MASSQHLKGHKEPLSAWSEQAVWVQPVLTPVISTEARGGKSTSSPELGQENLHHSCHVHIHMQREGGLWGSRGFNVVNLQKSVSARHSQSLRANRVTSWEWGATTLSQPCQHPHGSHTMMPPQRGLWKALVLTGAPSLSWMYRGEWERSGTYSRKFSTG